MKINNKNISNIWLFAMLALVGASSHAKSESQTSEAPSFTQKGYNAIIEIPGKITNGVKYVMTKIYPTSEKEINPASSSESKSNKSQEGGKTNIGSKLMNIASLPVRGMLSLWDGALNLAGLRTKKKEEIGTNNTEKMKMAESQNKPDIKDVDFEDIDTGSKRRQTIGKNSLSEKQFQEEDE